MPNQLSNNEAMVTRFAFGANWKRFLELLTDERIRAAERSLIELTGITDFSKKRILDIGCGSGLFSLAARRLGARVVSLDYDAESVACAKELKRRYFLDDPDWLIAEGSVLNEKFLETSFRENLDRVTDSRGFDLVYSWGVLHHTSNMNLALDHAMALVAQGGRFAISIYNDQGWLSKYWLSVKKLYHFSFVTRWLMIVVHFPYLVVARFLVRALTGRIRLERGMSYWHDMVDWLGGLPFEVATPEEIIHKVQANGFELTNLTTCGGRSGCNEYVFVRDTSL